MLLTALLTADVAAARSCPLPGIDPIALSGPVNVVPRQVLCPRLLRDGNALAAYIKAFPLRDYGVYRTRAGYRYYIDGGKDVIKSFLRKGIVWEARVRKLLRQHARRGTTVVDIGAHVGTHTIDLGRAVGKKGRVYAFEPQKKLYRELVRNVRLNGVQKTVLPLRFALGSGAKVIEMNRATAGNEGGTGVGRGGDKAELRTLDSFGLRNVSLLKIDVEGLEDSVLAGAKRTIANSRPVIAIEIQGGHDLDKASLVQQQRAWSTIALLNRLGYRVRRVDVHDYLGIPRDAKTRLPIAFERKLSVSHPRLNTRVGRRAGRTVLSAGRAGALVYGPYTYLPAGTYVVRWRGRVLSTSVISFDVVSSRARTRHALKRLRLAASAKSRVLATLAFTLAAPVPDFEARVVVDRTARVSVRELEILRLAP
jgi:FkbM family methyltransferase